MSPLDDSELRRRAIEGVRAEVKALAGGAPGSTVHERENLLAVVTPATPERSLFNSVYYEEPATLAADLGTVTDLYEANAIRAWTVWVRDDDPDTGALLEARGHVLDATPRAMAMELADLAPEPAGPDGVEEREGDPAVAGELNDLAYGYREPAFRAVLSPRSDLPIHWSIGYSGDEPVGCVGWIEISDDVCVTGVATPAEHRGRGIAGWLLRRVLGAARDRGTATASLQATKAGAPLYERLGFRDFGYLEMWERRQARNRA